MKEYAACTTVLVGKKASITGATMIARNDDTFAPITPQKFIVEPAVKGKPGRTIKSWLNKFEMELPADAQRVPAVPNVDYQHCGYYDESGINEANVAMSCTESTYGNERTLAFDPLVVDGLDEDCMQTVVLPYINSARAGVKRLGELIAKFGSAAGNSVLFSDANEVWYMEIVTGHHYVAQRIPDDAYAIAANRVSIEQVDFQAPDDFIWSDGIREFVETYHLNPDQTGWNFRHIFGTYTEQDRHYNTSRIWYGQKYFNPELDQDPEDPDLPFIRRTSKKISREDIQFILGSHYQDTLFDPFGKGSSEERHRFRPIGLNRTQNSHILELTDSENAGTAGVMWLCIGGPTFTPFIPFFSNMSDTDASFNQTAMTYNRRDAWWYYKGLAALVESHYPQFVQLDIKYLEKLNTYYRRRVVEVRREAAKLTGEALTHYLTQANQETVAYTRQETEAFCGKMLTQAIGLSKLTFNMDANL